MDLFAQQLACFVYHASPNEILATALAPDGALVAVLDRGIAGAPKHVLTPEATAQAIAQFRAREHSAVAPELRGVFDTAPQSAPPRPAVTKRQTKRRTRSSKQGV